MSLSLSLEAISKKIEWYQKTSQRHCSILVGEPYVSMISLWILRPGMVIRLKFNLEPSFFALLTIRLRHQSFDIHFDEESRIGTPLLRNLVWTGRGSINGISSPGEDSPWINSYCRLTNTLPTFKFNAN